MAKTVHRVRIDSSHHGGLEGTLDFVAWLILIVNLIAAFSILIATEFEGWLIATYLGFGGFVSYVLFRAIAEIVRLLKRIAGVPHGGSISRTRENIRYACGACGKYVFDDYFCHSCQTELTSESP